MTPELAAVADVLRALEDWQSAFDGASAVSGRAPDLEAERADMLADAAWWLGRLDDCIQAREAGLPDLRRTRRDAAGRAMRGVVVRASQLRGPALDCRRLVAAGAAVPRPRSELRCVRRGLLLREAETAAWFRRTRPGPGIGRRSDLAGPHLAILDLEAEALQTKGRVLIDQGEVAEGMGHLDEAMLFAVEGRARSIPVTGEDVLLVDQRVRGARRSPTASEWTEATMKLVERHPVRRSSRASAAVHCAWVVLKRRGSLAEAEREAARACEELTFSHVGNSAAAYAEVGDIRRRLG